MKTSNAKFLNKLALITTVAIIAGTGISAQAEETTKNLQVTASVIKSCSIATTELAFGNYNPLTNTNLNTSATINVACTKGTAGAAITLSAGGNSEGNTNRRLKSIVNNTFISYDLGLSSGGTDLTPSTPILLNPFTEEPQVTTVYGRIIANQNVPAGTDYSDNVSVTVTF